MSPDDKRAEPEGEGEGAGEGVSPPSEPVDDLESLAGALPQPSEAPPDGDDADFDALSKVAGSRIAAAGPAPVAAAPSQQTVRSTWTVPLLLGVGIGAGISVALFALGVGRPPSQVAPPATAQAGAPAPAAPEGPAPPAAAVRQADSVEPASPAPQAVAAQTLPAVEHIAVGTPQQARGARSSVPPEAPRSEASPRSDAPSQPAAPAAAVVVAPGTATADAPEASDDGLEKDAPATVALAKAAPPETVDRLLDEALSPSARRQELERKHEAALAAAELPLTPTRDQLTQAMVVLLPAIRGCAMGQHGMATAAIVVRSDGRVAGVEITGAPFVGASSGHCMEGVIRRARFPRFKQPTFRIKFPLAIQ
ncbi:MAG: hypothetical protein ACHQ53_10775 [Polyangiales bacterium]